jgi:sulfide:quinone oxidoreductase
MQFQHLNFYLVKCVSGTEITYDYLVVCPGIQLDWNKIEGLKTLGKNNVSSNTFQYAYVHGND